MTKSYSHRLKKASQEWSRVSTQTILDLTAIVKFVFTFSNNTNTWVQESAYSWRYLTSLYINKVVIDFSIKIFFKDPDLKYI